MRRNPSVVFWGSIECCSRYWLESGSCPAKEGHRHPYLKLQCFHFTAFKLSASACKVALSELNFDDLELTICGISFGCYSLMFCLLKPVLSSKVFQVAASTLRGCDLSPEVIIFRCTGYQGCCTIFCEMSLRTIVVKETCPMLDALELVLRQTPTHMLI